MSYFQKYALRLFASRRSPLLSQKSNSPYGTWEARGVQNKSIRIPHIGTIHLAQPSNNPPHAQQMARGGRRRGEGDSIWGKYELCDGYRVAEFFVDDWNGEASRVRRMIQCTNRLENKENDIIDIHTENR